MAAKRKVDNQLDCERNSPTLQNKRHETTSARDLSTNYNTDASQVSQWYEQRGQWIALYDWNSGHHYYQNLRDYRTQWEKPGEWDSIHPLYIPANQYNFHGFWNAPVNGPSTGNDASEEENYKLSAADVEAKVERLLSRPARRQIDPEERKKMHWIPEGATEYNIWYDRWVGEHWRSDKDHGQ